MFENSKLRSNGIVLILSEYDSFYYLHLWLFLCEFLCSIGGQALKFHNYQFQADSNMFILNE